MRYFLSIVAAIFIAVTPTIAQTSYDYEVWLDDDISSTLTGSFRGNAFTLDYDLSDTSESVHFLNLRLKNADGVWGATYRKMVLTIPNVNGAVKFEYWLDNDYNSKTEGSIAENNASYSIPLEGMKEGLHRFSYRLQQYDGQWGSVFSQMFYYSSYSRLSNYEYWIDNDYANKVSGSISSEDFAFNVNLDNIPQREYHFFNLRVRDGNGDWSSVYRKLFFSREINSPAKILGYSHALDGVDLGYVKLENNPSGIYTFDVELPEGVGIDIADVPIHFNGDILSVSHSDSVSYRIQIETDRGWSTPFSYSFEAGLNYSSEAEAMTIPSSLTFKRPNGSQFKAVKFESSGNTLYFGMNRSATMDIYHDATKVCSITPEELLETKILNLQSGTYYGVIYNVLNDELSDDVTLSIKDTNLENIQINYDGRFVSLTSAEENVAIYYTLDGSSLESGILYKEPFDIGGLHEILAIAKKGDDSTSGISSYTVKVYADEDHAETSTPGMLSSAFHWNVNFPMEVETYSVSGPLNDEDLGYIRTMSSLRHLDTSQAEIESIPDKAFSDMALISIVLPEKMKSYGEEIFSGCQLLSAIECYALNINIEKRLIASDSNPNLILYLSDRVSVSIDESMIYNVVRGQFANHLKIQHGYPFYAPKQFIAREATFTRNFSKTTGYDFCAGWETIALPFDVQSIKDEYSEIHPFAAETSGDRRFWLYSPDTNGWVRSSSIMAYLPYLISMPNNHWYADDMIINGDILFESKNVEIPSTPEAIGFAFKNGIQMYSNFMPVSSGNNIYTINNETFEGYAPGSVFVRDHRDAIPFECYMIAADQPKAIPVMDSSDVLTVAEDYKPKVWTEYGHICIYSTVNFRIRIFDTVGNLVRIADVKAGEVCRISDLYKGIYIIGTKKVYVK